MNSLNLYHIFYTVAQEQNISNASKKLFISQPAVSKAISKLETNLNSQLFVRSSKGVSLTDSGELLYQHLDTAFHAIKLGEEQLHKNEELGVGRLSIGVSTTLCKYVLLPYLQQFIQENPHIKITISCQSTYETISALENGNIDIGLVGETKQLGGLFFQPLQTITDVFVATQGYFDHLSSQTSSEEDLFANATLLLLDKKNITRQYIEKYFLLNNISIEQQIEVTTMDLLIDFAKIGLGVACVIRNFIEQELKEGSLIEFPMKEPIPARQIGFAYSQKIQFTTAMDKFIQFLAPLYEESSIS